VCERVTELWAATTSWQFFFLNPVFGYQRGCVWGGSGDFGWPLGGKESLKTLFLEIPVSGDSSRKLWNPYSE